MNTKGLSMYRGCRISSGTAKAAIVGTAFAMLGMTASAASASVIYQDSFSGSSTTALNGAAPTVHNGTSTTWTADSQWMDNGSVVTPTVNSGNANAWLAFTPASGYIYTLSEGVEATSSGNPYAGMGLAFSPSGFLGTSIASGAALSISSGEPGSGGNEITTCAGPGQANGNAYPYQGTGTVQGLQMVLNTGAAAWTVQFSDNGVALGPVFTYTTNPTIGAVGFGTMGTNAQVSNFSLTATPVPGPAPLALVAIGGLGLLLLKRRKAV